MLLKEMVDIAYLLFHEALLVTASKAFFVFDN